MITILKKVCGLCVLLALLCGTACAQTSSNSTQSIASISSAANNGTDKSMSLLQLVYGPIASNPLSSGGSSSATMSNGMISAVMLTFNSCVLAVAVLWAMYHFVSALIATGQDGEFMGAKRSSPWWIVRNALGFSALVPAFGGYCGAQVIMLWGTMMGVGIANLSLSAALSVLSAGGSMVATPVAPQVITLAKALYEANLCAQAANTAVQNLSSDAGVTADAGETFSASTSTGKVVLMNQNGLSCGGAEIDAPAVTSSSPPATTSVANLPLAYTPDTSAVTSSIQAAQQSALTAMQATLSTAATTYVTSVEAATQLTDPQATINQAAQAYQTSVTAAINSASSSISGLSSTIQTSLTSDGWIMLGAWYQTFAQANSQLTSAVNATATAVPPTDLDNLPYPQLYKDVMASYSQQIEQDASTSTSISTAAANLYTNTADPQHVFTSMFPGEAFVNQVISVTSNLGQPGATGNTTVNPLIGMQNLGGDILNTGSSMLDKYVGYKSTNIVIDSHLSGLVSSVTDVLSRGVSGAGSGAAKETVDALSPFLIMLVLALFFFGATLAIYLPMLPFIIWFSGVISWYAVVAEAVVASPLWAFAHLDGDGDGMGQRTTHGYIFLLNVMFRPVLMVFGFLLAGSGIVVLGTLLNTMFAVAMENVQYNSIQGLISIIAFIVLYVGLCQTLCNSVFSLIHVIPDQAFAWIGGQMAAMRAPLEAEAKGSFGGGMSEVGNAGRTLTPEGNMSAGVASKSASTPTGKSGPDNA